MGQRMNDLIAITGATGHLGLRVVRHLADLGAPLRLVVRDPARAPDIAGAEIAVADYEQPDTLRAALQGVRSVFLVSAHESATRMDLHRSVVRTIAEAGVQRVVYTSFLGASPQASFTFAREHAHTERAIREAGLELTALRDGLYGEYAPLLAQDGVIRGPAAEAVAGPHHTPAKNELRRSAQHRAQRVVVVQARCKSGCGDLGRGPRRPAARRADR